MLQSTTQRFAADESAIQLNGFAPPVDLPKDYAGPAWLPGTGRMIYWTGRVAIGLRHEARSQSEYASTVSSDWLQSLLLN